ncbi:DUF2521 family protein [Priestia megaterium]|nr:DUF2521 family protein [Priestia megaterium]
MKELGSFKDRRYQKEMLYERKILRDLSIERLHSKMKVNFYPLFYWSKIEDMNVEEYCMDIAIESFLLGARNSKFSIRGETIDQLKERCMHEEKLLIDTLYEVINNCFDDSYQESLYYICEQYVQDWWYEGCEAGVRRHRLRLI